MSLKIPAGPDQTQQGQLLVLVPLQSSISSENKHVFCRELGCKITRNLLFLHDFTLHLHCCAEEREGQEGWGVEGGFAMEKREGWMGCKSFEAPDLFIDLKLIVYNHSPSHLQA